MIYGIKQIEKQFPGFEARWCDGKLYDLTEVFERIIVEDKTYPPPPGPSLPGNREVIHVTNTQASFMAQHFDIYRPPSRKMYVVGNSIKFKKGGRTFVEVCFDIDRAKEDIAGFTDIDVIRINEAYVVESRPHKGDSVARRYTNIRLLDQRITDSGAHCGGQTKESIYGSKKLPEIELHLNSYPIDYTIDSDMNTILMVCQASLFYLNIRNIKQPTKRVPFQRDYYWPKAWGREYKVLSLSQTLTERSPGATLPTGYHYRGHFQRGHFKRRKSGVYWWNPHWRGDFEKGIVVKDYKMKETKHEPTEAPDVRDPGGNKACPVPVLRGADLLHPAAQGAGEETPRQR